MCCGALSVAAGAQITFLERHSDYQVTGTASDFSDLAYTYTASHRFKSNSATGEDYTFEWSQKIDAWPMPPIVTSDLAWNYNGINANGKHEYVFRLTDNQEHWFTVVNQGTYGTDFNKSWFVREAPSEDGHVADALFKGNGFLTQNANLFRVTLTLPKFIKGEGPGSLFAQVISQSAPHTFSADAQGPKFEWTAANVSHLDMVVRVHGTIVPEPTVVGAGALAFLLARRRSRR